MTIISIRIRYHNAHALVEILMCTDQRAAKAAKISTTLVYTDDQGRLANQLFSHAHLLAFCLEHSPRFSLFNQSLAPFRQHLGRGTEVFGGPARPFTLVARLLFARWSIRRFMKLIPPSTNSLARPDWLARHRHVVLHGLRDCDASLLHRHREGVLERIALRYHQELVDEIAARARSDCDYLIGVHIRHGDFRTFAGGALFVPTSDYARAMLEVKKSTPHRISFLVCSDERRNEAEFPGLDVTIATGTSPADDLTLLSRCNGVIGCHSTFAAWACFAGNIPLLPIESGMPAATIREAAKEFWTR
ncbi:alpha-1,2-fucosyltransferase [Tardiphaga sp. 813_E8_N1_3]|uniref:alpha-1,2-fucosyltransferase n=1 Tax=Tardiphaga sp. 813_E8_N1_3 TaxID=3240760 RepID=UPI003F24FA80